MNFIKPLKRSYYLTPLKVGIIISLFFTVVINTIVISTINTFAHELQWHYSLYCYSLIILMLFLIILSIHFLISWPYFLKLFWITNFLISSVAACLIHQYNIAISPGTIDSVIQTDANEVKDLITLKMVFFLILLGIIPSILLGIVKIDYTTKSSKIHYRILFFITTIAFATLVAWLIPCKLKTFIYYNKLYYKVIPINYLYAGKNYAINHWFAGKVRPIRKIGNGAQIGKIAANKKSLVILVIGETARYDHFHINGYKRNNTPSLEKHNVISFNKTFSCGTTTSYSLRCMLTDLERIHFQNNAKNETFLDIFNRLGFNVLWRENNSTCYGMCDNIKYEKDVYSGEVKSQYCNQGGTHVDEIMLTDIEKYIQNNTKVHQFIILHTKGSHNPYHHRYSKNMEIYKPVCLANDLNKCSLEEIVNTYDNTIYYTDYFLGKVIELLKRYPALNTAMIYMSDHGESLGEKGIYLHGAPYKIAPLAQKHIPFFLWISPTMAKNYNINISKLRSLANNPYSHDNLFHSIIGLYGINNIEEYNSNLDIFNTVRQNK